MDVRLFLTRIVAPAIAVVFLFVFASCGSRYDINKSYGRQARIDDANIFLSSGDCQGAKDSLQDLYIAYPYDEEVFLLWSATQSCFGGFSLINLLGNIADTSGNLYRALAKTMPGGGGRITAMYDSVDVLTRSFTQLNASERATSVNNYMVFLQLGVIGSILQAYGTPDLNGVKSVSIVYSNPRNAGELSNLDACALLAAFSTAIDSYNYSTLSGDADTAAALSRVSSVCGGSCTYKDRRACTGLAADPASVAASSLVTSLNTAWQ